MPGHPADFRVEIIKARPQGIVSPTLGAPVAGDVVEITDRVTREGFGSINRAAERDLLSFKTGDLTCTFDNTDGFFDDLFALFGATEIWGLRVYRRSDPTPQFYGCLIGVGSIAFDRKTRSVEVTAYGLTKLLDMTAAENVKRTLGPFTVTTATIGATTITLNSTAGLLTGDVLHLTDHVNSEDVTVKQVTSATVCSLEAALLHTYAAGNVVECTTPFYRHKSIQWLVEQLFTEAGIGIADLRLSDSQFNRLAPTPVNLEGLSLANNARRGMGQYTGRWNVGIHGVDDYSQGEPDEAWTVQGSVDRGLYDHSPYFPQGYDFVGLLGSAYPGEPQPGLFEPVAGVTQESAGGGRFATYWGAVDYTTSPYRIWGLGLGTVPSMLRERTTVDGVAYTAITNVVLPANDNITPGSGGLEYDPVRDIVHVAWTGPGGLGTTRHFRYYDLVGLAWTDCKQGGDAVTTGYYGPRYIADLDYTLVLRNVTASSVGPAFTICAFRGATILWERPFPSCLIADAVASNPYIYPTRTARYINGSIYLVLIADGAVQLVRTDDEFQTYVMRELAPSTTNTTIMACRMGDTYRIACYTGASPRGYYIAAPLYAGVVDYADFDGLSCAEALKKLAVLANAVFSVDDDLQGHFVARDLYDPGAVEDIDDRIMERADTLLWEETAQYATVAGNSVEATAGDAAFAADGIELETSFLPNEAFAQALADAYYLFYSVARRYLELMVHDRDGRIYRPLDRVTVGGIRCLVHESDHSLMDDEITLRLLEDR
jgi:hypothetical protein